MIHIEFTQPQTKVWKLWVKACEDEAIHLKKNYKPGMAVEVTDLYRRKSIKKEVYFAKDGPFRGRCAYCECNITDFQHGDIEHFRPKKGVTDEHDEPAFIDAPDGAKLEHPGYYWLAYDWRNLLPSCTTCNQPGQEGIGKRNRFPVEDGKYAANEQEIAEEKPLLLNPLDPADDPEEHLGIDLDSGFMTFKNDSKRGHACIRIFGLNIRDQLVNERRSALEEVKGKFAALLYAPKEKTPAIRKEIEDMERGNLNYTLARRAQIKEVYERLPRLKTA